MTTRKVTYKAKQTPMLMESVLTNRVFIVTRYKELPNGCFEALEKYDVTEEFNALARERFNHDSSQS